MNIPFLNRFKKKPAQPAHRTAPKLPTKKEYIRRVNAANTIFNSFLRHGKAVAQQAANAYYMRGRRGVREFVARLNKQNA